MILTAVFLISNIHCPSCVSYVQDVLNPVQGVTAEPVVSLIDHTVRVTYDSDIIDHKRIAETLQSAAFEVQHVTVLDSRGVTTHEYSLLVSDTKPQRFWRQTLSSNQRKHIKNCRACQQERARTSSFRSKWLNRRRTATNREDGDLERGEAVRGGVDAGVEPPTASDVDRSQAPHGDETTSSVPLRGVFSIEGMTCSVCVGTITRGLQELSFVKDVSVDLVSNSASVELEDRANVGRIIEKIDDLGYDATLVTLVEANAAVKQRRERTIQIKVDGMYCGHCPEKILQALESLQSNIGDEQPRKAFQIVEQPTPDHPILTLTYQPSSNPRLTVRQFISTINAIEPAFQAAIFHPPTIEERARRMQHRERWYILKRLIFTGVVAIPTFVIGIVFMDLVSSHNSIRVWFEEPIWSGSAKRAEWALLIMTTPVMLFGSDLFHKRAIKEIWAMWKPSNRVPFLRRFYRFGSMNLLISIGTIVAYFSSLAILILEATTPPDPSSRYHGSDTYFDSVTFLTFFILIGRYLEAYSKAKTGDAVAMLSSLRPTEATLVEDGLKRIPVDQLEVDDVVQIPHGQSPPTDGIVQQDGDFVFDESSLTGESMPVKKSKGSLIYTGSVNISDPVQIRVTEVGGTSMLDQIIEVVRQGQSKRAPIERLADLLTGHFVPIICLLAILTWLIWLGLGTTGKLPHAWLDVQRGGWAFWSLEFAIAVFVVACPCGLGLAAPTALFVGGGLAAKNGILVQGGGEAFQEASQLDSVVFDKTGTLTQGRMKVTDMEIISPTIDRDMILALSKALEETSNHPIAIAIVDHCKDVPLQIKSTEVKEIPGHGLKGIFTFDREGEEIRYEAAIGNEKLLEFLRQNRDDGSFVESSSEKGMIEVKTSAEPEENYFLQQLLQKYQSQAYSTAILATRRLENDVDEEAASTPVLQPVAVFAIADPIKPEAQEVLEALRSRGVEVYLCTGDNQTTANAVASQLGIAVAHVRSGVLPHEKAEFITSLQQANSASSGRERRIVAFVGDGTNDTPALTAADVSIALSSGSDVAVNSASFILLNSDLGTILTLVSLAKRVFNRVKLNFAWAAVYNVCLIPVAAGAFFAVGANEEHGGWRLGPVWASAAMAASSVSVVLSSLALRLPEMRLDGLWKRK